MVYGQLITGNFDLSKRKGGDVTWKKRRKWRECGMRK